MVNAAAALEDLKNRLVTGLKNCVEIESTSTVSALMNSIALFLRGLMEMRKM